MRIPRAAFGAALLLLLLAPAAAAEQLEAGEAEALVRARWFEGIPAERIAPLSAGAVAHLDGLLRDAAEAEHHAACVELLGRAGGPGAFRVLVDFAARQPEGAVDGATYRARLALPLAWGELARRDPRAVAPLLALARADAEAPPWRHRHLDRARLGALRRKLARAALRRTGLGGAEIEAVLREPAGAPDAGRP